MEACNGRISVETVEPRASSLKDIGAAYLALREAECARYQAKAAYERATRERDAIRNCLAKLCNEQPTD